MKVIFLVFHLQLRLKLFTLTNSKSSFRQLAHHLESNSNLRKRTMEFKLSSKHTTVQCPVLGVLKSIKIDTLL